MNLRTFDRIRLVATAYERVARLVEPQTSRSVAVVGSSRKRPAEHAPVNIEASALVDEIERTVDEWLSRAGKIGAGVSKWDPEPRPVSVPTAARMLGVSRPRVWQLISTGRLPAERIDGRMLVLSTHLDDVAFELNLRDGEAGKRAFP